MIDMTRREQQLLSNYDKYSTNITLVSRQAFHHNLADVSRMFRGCFKPTHNKLVIEYINALL